MKVLIINNLASGPGDDSIFGFMHMLARPGLEMTMRIVEKDQPIEALLADATSYDLVVAAGGDGTVSSVLYSLKHTGITVLPFPSGTANILALNLDLPVTASGLANLVDSGTVATFDLGELEAVDTKTREKVTKGFSIVAGAGYDAVVVETADSMKQSLGQAAYVAGVLANLVPTYAKVMLDIDGEKIETNGISVFMLNFGRFQFDLKVSPTFDPQDGLFDVGVANTKMTLGLLPILASMGLDPAGTHLGRPDALEIYQAKRVEVVCDPPLPIEFDGESSTLSTPLVARILPGAARILVPKDSPFAPSTE